MSLYPKGKKESSSPTRIGNFSIPYEKHGFIPPRKSTNANSKDSSLKDNKERKGLYLFG